MAGETGAEDRPSAVRRHFNSQAKACERLGSPFTARLCRLLAAGLGEDITVGRRVLNWSGDPAVDALALRLCGGLHALVLAGEDPELASVYPPSDVADSALAAVAAAACGRNDGVLMQWLDKPPQTNEIARSAMLLPGFLLIARETGLPLTLHEIGSSAGLNLFFDSFHYDYAGRRWGPVDSPAQLAPDVRGSPPPFDGALCISSRAGNDIMPVDIFEPGERLRLRSYIWADQAARLARLDAAISIASREPFTLARTDAAEFVRDRLARRRPGETFVLFHSIMWQYLPRASKEGVRAALDAAGSEAMADAPIARLRMEPLGPAPHATLSLTMWPGGETRRLASCDYHGRWIAWK